MGNKLDNKGRRLAEAEGLGFVRGFDHTNNRTVWRIKCSKCGKEETHAWAATSRPEDLITNIVRAGWQAGYHVKPVCPHCQQQKKGTDMSAAVMHTSTPSKAAPTTQNRAAHAAPINPKISRRVTELLIERLNETEKRYEDGWDDARVAKEAGTSEKFVEEFRRQGFCELVPIEDPKITALASKIADFGTEITNLTLEFAGLQAQLEALRSPHHKAGG